MPSHSLVAHSAIPASRLFAMLRKVLENCQSVIPGPRVQALPQSVQTLTRDQFFKANPNETDLSLLLSRYDRQAGIQPYGAD